MALLPRDFVEILAALNEDGVEYLVIGAHCLGAHGFPRSTKDFDIWVRPTPENAARTMSALAKFGAPLSALGATEEDFSRSGFVLQLGVEPIRIDISTAITGVEFAPAWERRVQTGMADVEVSVLSLEDLLANKRAMGRPKDLADVDAIERMILGKKP